MFERYTEKARRVIFFARYEASQFGSPYIETEHLLLGLLREDKALAHRFLGTTSSEPIRKYVEAHTIRREKISTSVDMPLSQECKRVLAHGAEEGQRLNHEHLGTEHLLLGLLREEKCFAAEILHERGLQLELVRDNVASGGSTRFDPSELDKFRKSLVAYFGARQKEWGVTVAIEPRVVSHSRTLVSTQANQLPAKRPSCASKSYPRMTDSESYRSASTTTSPVAFATCGCSIRLRAAPTSPPPQPVYAR
jgi:ATP-dependent Clp protease ATP-binding subunit ClpC